MSNTSWRRFDFRRASLNVTIMGLQQTIDVLHAQTEEIHWYDGDWFLEESEPIYGLAFIAFQNYINGSIKDFDGDTTKKTGYYKKGKPLTGFSKTDIELIIALANYAKHKDEGHPHKGTAEVLNELGLNFTDVIYLDQSAMFQGLELLDSKWELSAILESVIAWRESLWT
ncbi:hypothetical protein [Mucilaginibacter agri]|uniref:Uncharacterized protein n=1 Tax=Mucilaginibacter agri TaxID=2695265 RepID=A0A965ZDG3_9SPHI|nr:hypothetical protein [Mucilaginibacter agri]NCD68097.1 hypothetical protein [Mucilaginibacter agri]